ncbi:MAG: hypothetical protein E7263_11065 [Lachnospiraceae bacterium]|nr:hypothetical protein [Lachnospiraceae bacterium]
MKNNDDGYNDIYDDADYDWDRYQEDDDYASGVDDAMDEWNEEYGEDWRWQKSLLLFSHSCGGL